MNVLFLPITCARVLSKSAAALYLFIITDADESGVCVADEVVVDYWGFSGIELENSLEELIQEGFVEDHTEENSYIRKVRICGFQSFGQQRLSANKWALLRVRVFERDGFSCRYCGRSGTAYELECDHVQPLSLGGTNEMGNLVTACQTCNRSKRDRLIEEWRGRVLA